jgi:hydrogenase nickel incorporation protein HypB
VVVLSVTEGEDKPLKYPGSFRRAELMVINKIELLRHVPFRMDLARENARRINPRIEIIATSCSTGAGLGHWMNWLAERAGKKSKVGALEVVHLRTFVNERAAAEIGE